MLEESMLEESMLEETMLDTAAGRDALAGDMGTRAATHYILSRCYV